MAGADAARPASRCRIKFTANGCAELHQGGDVVRLHYWQAQVVTAAMCRPWLSCEEIANIVWPGRTLCPSRIVLGVTVRLCKLRKITRRFGFEVSAGSGRRDYRLMMGPRTMSFRYNSLLDIRKLS